jgi:hypothetical protein
MTCEALDSNFIYNDHPDLVKYLYYFCAHTLESRGHIDLEFKKQTFWSITREPNDSQPLNRSINIMSKTKPY